MGGAVALTIRKRGRVQTRLVPKYHACLPTGSDFLDKKPGQATGFQADWKAAPVIALAPKNYGLVVIDHATKWVGSCNDYADIFEGMFSIDRDYQMNNLVRLFEQGRIESVALGSANGPDIPLDLPTASTGNANPMVITARHIRNAVRRASPDGREFGSLFAQVAPPPGWTFESFDNESPDDWMEFMSSLDQRAMGAKTQEDLAQWEDYFQGKEFQFNPADVWCAGLQASELEQSLPVHPPQAPSRRRTL